ncbi:MAG: hypothetical protein R2755_09830 [Acidimicrobiales bacterium]
MRCPALTPPTACGPPPASSWPRRLPLPRRWHAFRQYFSGATAGARHRQHIWFPADLLPAYIWSFPLADGTVNIGFGILRDGPVPMGDTGELWRTLLARPEVRAVLGDGLVPDGAMRAWPIPAWIDEATLSACGGRVLFAGDAATAPDPMTGEGIGQALLTGRLAAEAVLHGRSDGAGARPDAVVPATGDAAAVAVAPPTTPRSGATCGPTTGSPVRSARSWPTGAAPSGPAGGRPQRLDEAELRPMDVRGLPAGRVGNTQTVAAGSVHRARRLRRAGVTAV